MVDSHLGAFRDEGGKYFVRSTRATMLPRFSQIVVDPGPLDPGNGKSGNPTPERQGGCLKLLKFISE